MTEHGERTDGNLQAADAVGGSMMERRAAHERLSTGERSWYIPRFLDRLLPKVTIEPPHDAEVPRTVGEERPVRRPLTGLQAPEASVARAVVLVEGVSDQRALEALARRRGRNLAAEGISIVPIGGAQAIGGFLELFGPQGLDVRLAGLCDAAEEREFQRGLERAGLGSNLTRADLETLGFYVCVEDLEDELIRSLGAAAVEQIVEAQGHLGSFRTLQTQPEWRGRAEEEQLRRFLGSGGGRKVLYGALLVDALDLTRVPRPLDGVLAHV